MKKSDIYLFLSVVLLGGVLLLSGKITKTSGDTVIITKDGKAFGEYPLYTDAEIAVGDTNRVKIEHGSAYMHTATCPDKLCINQGKAKDSSKKIICLPNRITVEITKKSEIDKVVR